MSDAVEGVGEDNPDLCIQAVLDMIDADEIKPEQASALQSALFRRTGRNLGKAITEAFAKDPKFGPLFKAPVDLGLEDVDPEAPRD